MSKWIDADEAEKLLRAGCAYAIWELPSIDIVRCQDCRHRYMDADLQVWTCTYGLMIKPDGFCNYGEREGE